MCFCYPPRAWQKKKTGIWHRTFLPLTCDICCTGSCATERGQECSDMSCHEPACYISMKYFFLNTENPPHFMDPEISLSHSQVPAIFPYPEPARSSPYPHILFPEDPSWYYPSIYAWVSQVVSIPQVFPPRPCIRLTNFRTDTDFLNTSPVHSLLYVNQPTIAQFK